MDRPNRSHCRKEGGCLDQNGRTITICPTGREIERYFEQTPLVPAERLCLDGLSAVKESRAKPVLVDSLADVSFDLDRAIALPSVIWDEDGSLMKDNRAIKLDIFRQVAATLHTASREQAGRHLPISLQLSRIGIFMAAFRARVESRRVDSGLVRQTHGGLCDYIAKLDRRIQSASGNHAVQKILAAHKAETEVMALLTRQGIMVYPALAREEASHERSQFNHDFYELSSGDRKKPYQVKTSSNGRGYTNVAVIRHYEILHGFRQDPTTHRVEWRPARNHEDFEWPNPYRYEQVLVGEKPSPLGMLLAEEASLGGRLPQDKRNALNLASHFVRSH